jgi:hypothetical protein
VKAFVFRITQACNKKCPTCCCERSGDVLDPWRYKHKLHDVAAYCSREKEEPVVFFSGGESFFYRSREKDGKRIDIAGLVGVTLQVLPRARVVVKTAGWTRHRVLDQLLNEVEGFSERNKVDVRLGFNLFQNKGVDAVARLQHMVAEILRHQDVMRIETIYDRHNLAKTFDVITEALKEFGFPEGEGLRRSVTRPEAYHRFRIPIEYCNNRGKAASGSGRTIILDTMPAYEGLEGVGSSGFFKADWGGLCPLIEQGPDHILYNPDLSFYQCNDAFADYSRPGFRPEHFGCVSEEFSFLRATFARLKKDVERKKETFQSKREQCLRCSDFFQLNSSGLCLPKTLSRHRVKECRRW